MTPPIGTSILYCLAPADIAPGLRMRQTEFAAIVTAAHSEGLVDLTYFPPPGIGLDTVAQAALVPHRGLCGPL